MMARPFADAVIVAAGSSRRMLGTDKLVFPLAGRPALAWAVAALRAAESVAGLVVVTSPERMEWLRERTWIRAAGANVVIGGADRQDSVARGLAHTSSEVVLVHDGARPFVRPDVVDAVAHGARRDGAAIPVLPVVDSLKWLDARGVASAIDRAGLYAAQTPQGAHRELLMAAYEAARRLGRSFGDEAAMLEADGVPVTTVPGDPANLKLTGPADLEAAQAVAALRTGATRYSSASDTHPFGPDDGLRLGGIELPDAPRLLGHSDGDVALHAVTDALLVASGLPDLGRAFPATDPATRGIASRELLRVAVERVAGSGWRPASADVTIVGARPRLGGGRLDAMRQVMAGLLSLPSEQVTIKASTGNLSGPEGAGLVITAGALVGVVAA